MSGLLSLLINLFPAILALIRKVLAFLPMIAQLFGIKVA